MAVVGLSGGGPYTLACAAAMPERVVAAGVVGGVAPPTRTRRYRRRPDGEPRHACRAAAPGREGCRSEWSPLTLVRFIRPVAGPAADLYGLVSPPADRALLARPEIKAMFLDDLLNGSRRQMAAPFYDVVAFARDWGFRLDEVEGARALVARRRRPHRSLRARAARGVEAARRRAASRCRVKAISAASAAPRRSCARCSRCGTAPDTD